MNGKDIVWNCSMYSRSGENVSSFTERGPAFSTQNILLHSEACQIVFPTHCPTGAILESDSSYDADGLTCM